MTGYPEELAPAASRRRRATLPARAPLRVDHLLVKGFELLGILLALALLVLFVLLVHALVNP